MYRFYQALLEIGYIIYYNVEIINLQVIYYPNDNK